MSVTIPTACALPRSASFVTVAGLISTATNGTEAGRRFPVRDRVQHRRDHDREAHPGELRSHCTLAFDHVGVDIGQRPVVAYRADQHEWPPGLHHCVHHAAGEDAIVDGLLDRAGRADRVDRADVVLVTMRDTHADGEVDPERRPEQRGLDVMRGECVAAEQHVHPALLDERDHRHRRAGVHDGGAGHPKDAAAVVLHLTHSGGDLSHEQRLWLLARHSRCHELEVAFDCLVLARWQHHLDAARSAHDLVARLHVADRNGSNPAAAHESGRSPSRVARPAPTGRSSRTTVSRFVVE